ANLESRYRGRTCRGCQRHADILHVTPCRGWQDWRDKSTYALQAAGLGYRCAELAGPSPAALEAAIQQRQPRVVFVHAFAVATTSITALAERWPAIRFVIIAHSGENHVLTWPGFF